MKELLVDCSRGSFAKGCVVDLLPTNSGAVKESLSGTLRVDDPKAGAVASLLGAVMVLEGFDAPNTCVALEVSGGGFESLGAVQVLLSLLEEGKLAVSVSPLNSPPF